jgi:hypothetical protein
MALSFSLGSIVVTSADVGGSNMSFSGTPVFVGWFWYCTSHGSQLESIPGGGGVYTSSATGSLGSSYSSCASPNAVNVSTVYLDNQILKFSGGDWHVCAGFALSSASNFWLTVLERSASCGSGIYGVPTGTAYVFNNNPNFSYATYYWPGPVYETHS